MPASPNIAPTELRARLERIYPGRADEAIAQIESATADVAARLAQQPAPRTDRWNERDVVLITYADQLREDARSAEVRPPLGVLCDWLVREGLDKLINTVHLLPFCPYSSDDGFSVIDYLAVDPAAGDWPDIARLGEDFALMFDLVLNHISQHSEWFAAYARGESPFDKFFIEVDPQEDHSQVVRPRPGPPWKQVETSRGAKHVWSTFSDGAVKDQIDLNYAEPAVVAHMIRILLEYAERGARIVRLDAVAFLWKVVGTNCLHLPETHEIVRLCRDLLARHAPQTLVLTETNVPHAENVSYFGQVDPATGEGDEAHMVYNFSLPPLLLEAFVSGDATAIRQWLANLAPPPPGCTFFNFAASHDGIGVRPLEGLVSAERLEQLVAAVRQRGGKINTRSAADGTEVPYELNIAFVDALSPEAETNPPPPLGEGVRCGGEKTNLHARRFLASQAVMLAVRGMPAVYFHSLVGTQNDYAGVEASGQNRRINRHKYERAELDAHLASPGSLARQIYDGYRELLALRIAQPAFHPDAPQQVVDVGNDHILAFSRTSLDRAQSILVLVNFSQREQSYTPPAAGKFAELKTGQPFNQSSLPPGGFVYLESQD